MSKDIEFLEEKKETTKLIKIADIIYDKTLGRGAKVSLLVHKIGISREAAKYLTKYEIETPPTQTLRKISTHTHDFLRNHVGEQDEINCASA